MSQLKVLTRLEEKLDRVLSWIEAQGGPATSAPVPTAPDPALVAAALDYDTYTAKEIIERAPSLSETERVALVEYESAGKARVSVLEALEAIQ